MIALLSQWRIAAGAGAVAVILALLALWRIEARRVQRLEEQVQAAQAAQKGAQAHAAAASDAEAVIADGAQRDQRTLSVHAENSHAIQTAQGSGQTLDTALNDAGRRGLCSYSGYATDPQCLQLLGADPGRGSKADPADPAAGH